MDQEYKYTFNNLKHELKSLDTEQLKAKLKEQQQELFKSNAKIVSGAKRVMYNKEMKLNIKKLHKIIAVIKNLIAQKQND